MILDDGNIGLIDYGQVKEISTEVRINIAKLILALAAKNDEKVVKCWTDCGFKSKNMNPYVILKHAQFHFDSFGPQVVDELGIYYYVFIIVIVLLYYNVFFKRWFSSIYGKFTKN